MAKRSEEYNRALNLLRRLPDEEIDRFADLIQRKISKPEFDGESKERIVTIEFDTALCKPYPWKGPLTITGLEIIPGISEKVNRLLDGGSIVAIYSHRIKYDSGDTVVRNFCAKNGINVDHQNIWFTSAVPRGSELLNKEFIITK